jgi:hypothetical protein
MPDAGKYDPEIILGFDRCKLHQEATLGLNRDRTITLRWEVAPDALEECEAWAKSKRRTVSKFVVEGADYPAVWRHVKVEIADRGGADRNKPAILLHTFALGYITTLGSGGTIDWTEARWPQAGPTESPGNSAAATGISASASDNPAKYLVAEFRNCAPEKARSIASEFSSLEYTNPIIDGETITGTFHRIMASWRKEEDGSATVTVHLAQPQYTLEAFSNLNLSTAESIFYLWRVPKAIAQTIITAWKTTGTAEELAGRSATASYSSDQELVNLILTAKGEAAQNLSTDPMWVACDTVEVQHFAWGYTEDALALFLAAHTGNSPHAGDEAGEGGQPDPLAWSGRRRQTRVTNRSDGLFDAIVVETKREYDPDKHLWEMDLTTGIAFVRSTEWGWGVPMSRMEAIKALYETATLGATKRFQVSRQDDCTFDYIGEIVAEGAQSIVYEGVGDGIRTRLTAATGITKAQLDSITPDSSILRQVDARIDLKENGLADAVISERDIVATVRGPLVIEKGAQEGTGLKFWRGTNAEHSDFAAALAQATSGLRKSHSVTYQPNDAGGIDYLIMEQEENSPEGTLSIPLDETTPVGEGISVKSGLCASVAELAALSSSFAAARRKSVNVSVDPRPDGGFRYVILSRETVATEIEFSAGSVGRPESVKVGTDTDTMPTIDAPAVGERVLVEARPGRDGAMNYEIRRRGSAAVQRTTTAGTYSMRKTIVATASDPNALASYTPVVGKSYEIQIQLGDDGVAEWNLVQLDRVGMAKQFPFSRREPRYEEAGFDEDVYVFEGLSEVPVPATQHFYFSRFQINEDYTFSGVLHQLKYDFDSAMWSQLTGACHMYRYEYLRDGLKVYRRSIRYAVSWSTTPWGHQVPSQLSNSDIEGYNISSFWRHGRSWYTWRRVAIDEEGAFEQVAP